MTWPCLLLMDLTRGNPAPSLPSVQYRGLYILLNAVAMWSTSVPVFEVEEGLRRFGIHHFSMEGDWLVRHFTHGHSLHTSLSSCCRLSNTRYAPQE